MEQRDHIDEQIKQKLAGLEVQPGIRSFHEVMRKMENEKKRRRFIAWFWTGALLLLLLGGVGLYGFFGKRTNTAAHFISDKKAAKAIKTESVHNLMPAKKNLAIKTQSGTQTLAIHNATTRISQHSNTKLQKHVNSRGSAKKTNLAAKRFDKVIEKEQGTGQEEDEAIATTFTNAFSAGTGNIVLITNLPAISIFLPYDSNLADIGTPLTLPSALDSLPYIPEKINFYIGLDGDPQLSSFVYLKNDRQNAVYNNGSDFSSHYLNSRKKNNSFTFTYGFGIKAGVILHNKYELFAGFGIQKYTQNEQLYYDSASTIPPTVPNNNTYTFAADKEIYSNHFNYYRYSLEANRIFRSSGKIRYKLGLVMYANQLKPSGSIIVTSPNVSYYNNSGAMYSSWLYTAGVRSGAIANAGKRFQFQLCPTFFYSPSSIFKNDYLIKQKPFGFSVECVVLFRLL